VSRLNVLTAVILFALFLQELLLPPSPEKDGVGFFGAVSGYLLLPLLLFHWLKEDARQRRLSPPPGATTLCALSWSVAWLYYVLGTRNLVGAAKTIALALVMAAAAILAGHALSSYLLIPGAA
jgi:CDP-diglyceride synthetase